MSIFCIFPLFFISFPYLIDASDIQEIIEQQQTQRITFAIGDEQNITQKEYTVYKNYFKKENFFSEIYTPKEKNQLFMPATISKKWNIGNDIITLSYENNVINVTINHQIIEGSMLDLIFNLLYINKQSDWILYNALEQNSIDTLYTIQLLGNILSVDDSFQKKIELHINYKQIETAKTYFFVLINNAYSDKICCTQQPCLREGYCENQFYGILLIYQYALQKNNNLTLNKSSNTVDFSFLEKINDFNECKWLRTFKQYKKIYKYLSHLGLFPKKDAVTDVILDLFRLEIYAPHSSFLHSLRKKFKNLKRVYVSSDYIGIVRSYEKVHFFYYSHSTNYDNRYSGSFNPLTIYVADTQQAEESLKNASLFYYKYSVLLENLNLFTCILCLFTSIKIVPMLILDLPVIHNYYTKLFSFVFLVSTIYTIECTKCTGTINNTIYWKLLKKSNNNINDINWEKIYNIKPALVYTFPIICYLLYLIARKITFNMCLKELLLNKNHFGGLLLFIVLKSLTKFRKERLLYMIATHRIFKPRQEYHEILSHNNYINIT